MNGRTLAFALLLVGILVSVDGLASALEDGCQVIGERVVCDITGTIPVPGTPGTDPPSQRPPIRYLVVDTDFTGTDCYWWSRVPVPGAIDTWDPGNDPTTIITLLNYPPCAIAPAAPAVDPATRAWEVYRSWTLAPPSPSLSPPTTGITGLPTEVTATVTPLTHRETLPGGIELVVSAQVTSATVTWGDGAFGTYDDLATPATHTYELKTCTAEDRATDPNAHLCHPTLDAYPVTVTFTWTAGYRYDAGWVELESVALSTTVIYDVDEVVAVPSG